MKVLIATNSAATRSSYGIVSREIWKRIAKADPSIEIVQHGWFHQPVEEVPWDIIPTNNPAARPNPDGTFEKMPDIYGAQSFPEVVGKVRPDVVWGLGDPWMLEVQPKMKRQGGYKYVFYCPVDSEPYTPRWGPDMAEADELVAMTTYGQEVLQQVPQLRGRHVHVIPHGVDLEVFGPVEKATKERYREDIGGGYISKDMFVLGWVGKDQYRKQIWQLYEMMYYLHSGNYFVCEECGKVTVMEYDPNMRAPRAKGKLRMYDSNYKYAHCWHCKSKKFRRGKSRKDIVLWTHMRNAPATGYDIQHLAYIYQIDGSVFDAAQCVDDRGLPAQAVNYIYNCLSRDTRFVTSSGMRSFNDFEDGDRVTVLTPQGHWKQATVRSYGESQLNKITIRRSGRDFIVRATPNHRWFLQEPGKVTENLEVGDKLLPPSDIFSDFVYEEAPADERLYWAYGLVYGDGTCVKDSHGEYKYSMIRLCGNDTQFAKRFEELGFKTSTSDSLNGDVMAYTGSYLKTLPDPDQDSPRLIRAFVRGLLDADGGKSYMGNANQFFSIYQKNPNAIEFIRRVFPVAGVHVLGETNKNGVRTNFGTHTGVEFKIANNLDSKFHPFKVVSIESDGVDEVWCLEVEDDHAFVLEHGIPTGNCFDALIYPTGGEGFGLPVLEAMACGVPSIYANYSGHTSFARGLPVRVRIFPEVRTQRFRAMVDMNDLVKQVLTLADDKDLQHRLKKQSLKTAGKMSWDTYTQDWLNILERAHNSRTSQSLGDIL